MLFRLVLIAAIIFLCPLFGQQNDFSMWTRSMAGTTSVIPWYMNFSNKVVVDTRFNYDAPDTLGVCLGKKLGSETFFLVPEACGYMGKVDGFGPELLVLGSKGRFSLFSQNQFVRGTNPADSFLYHWFDGLVAINKRLALGVDWQAFKPTNTPAMTAVDIGPAAKISVWKMYFRVWPAWAIDPNDHDRRGNPTLFLGIGYAW